MSEAQSRTLAYAHVSSASSTRFVFKFIPKRLFHEIWSSLYWNLATEYKINPAPKHTHENFQRWKFQLQHHMRWNVDQLWW